MEVLGVFVRQIDAARMIEMARSLAEEKGIEYATLLLDGRPPQMEKLCQHIADCNPEILICSIALTEEEEQDLERSTHTQLLVGQLIRSLKLKLPGLRVVMLTPQLWHSESAMYLGANWTLSRSYCGNATMFHYFRNFLDYKKERDSWKYSPRAESLDLGWKPND